MRLKHAASIFYAHFSLRKGEKLFSHFSLLKANVAVATRRKPKVCTALLWVFYSSIIPHSKPPHFSHTFLLLLYMSRNSRVFTTHYGCYGNFWTIYMSRNSRVFTTGKTRVVFMSLIYISRNSRVFTTYMYKNVLQ